MLGMFHLLPLLKGWEYKGHRIERIVERGASPLEVRISEIGWLWALSMLTNDCYGRVTILWQGADLETKRLSTTPEDYKELAAWAQDPGGWAQRYFRPNPFSTAGIYFIPIFSGLQGLTLPYVPTVTMQVSLDSESTQSSATVGFYGGTIAITDKKAFIRSLRRVLDAKASLKIDPALLTFGRAEFEGEKK